MLTEPSVKQDVSTFSSLAVESRIEVQKAITAAVKVIEARAAANKIRTREGEGEGEGEGKRQKKTERGGGWVRQ